MLEKRVNYARVVHNHDKKSVNSVKKNYGMALPSNMFLMVSPNFVPSFMLLSQNAQSSHVSAGLTGVFAVLPSRPLRASLYMVSH